ncbi:hypothetical protein [Rhodococcus sp. B50]|uniref:hypothetical protein n=1 Tax=Rhodococcus sp. B50 TaxID=2682847 RepID=UPI001FD61D72|nr:hypothetical protein [Rhodococcus sp. B50]
MLLLINIPVIVLLFTSGRRLIPAYRVPTIDTFVDFTAVVLSMAGSLPLVYAVRTVASDYVTTAVVDQSLT